MVLPGNLNIFKDGWEGPCWCGSVGWSVVPYTKRLEVRFPLRARLGGKQLMFLSHISECLSLSLPPPSYLSKINKLKKKKDGWEGGLETSLMVTARILLSLSFCPCSVAVAATSTVH